MSGDRGSVSSVLVCWSLDLGSTPDGGLSFSFPLDFFDLCISTSKVNTCECLLMYLQNTCVCVVQIHVHACIHVV